MSHSHLITQVVESNAPIMVVDQSHLIHFANRAAEQLVADYEVDFTWLWPNLNEKGIVGQRLDVLAQKSSNQNLSSRIDNTLPYQVELRLGRTIFSLLIGAHYGKNGDLLGQSVQWEDVTLRQGENVIDIDDRAQLEAITRSQMVVQMSLDGDVLTANEQFLDTMGYELGDVVGKHHSIFVTAAERNGECDRKLWARLRKGDYVSAEFKRIANDGREVWIRAVYNPIRDRNGELTKVIKYAYDITDRIRIENDLKRAENRFRHANHQVEHLNRELAQQIDLAQELADRADEANVSKSEFLANMSHEIRTPMTAILGFTEILLDSDLDTEIRDAAVTVKRNGEHLIELINDILDLSKIESGKLRLEHTPTSPRQIVEEVFSLMNVRAVAKALPFKTEFEGAIPKTIQTDPTRLRQILVNLVGNGIKFTEMGYVKVITRLTQPSNAEPMMSFRVVDTGIGISSDRIATLFSPFTQADNSTTREYGGTGLGLTISKRLVEALGGCIQVKSTRGQGSSFTVLIPTGSLAGVEMISVRDDRTAGQTQKSGQLPESNNLNGARILLAEDGPDNQRLIAFLLRKAGAEVEVADNGKIALELALEKVGTDSAYDLILMDMQMPEMDGYEATRQLRAANFNCPIIAVTAHAMSTDREKCLLAGCDDYLTKPVNRDQMIGTVINYARKRRDLAH